MGYDLYARNAQNKKNDYFRNNVWYWRPLWNYICSLDILSPKQMNMGTANNCETISKKTSLLLATKLKELLENGTVYQYQKNYEKETNELPDEQCTTCKGTGERLGVEQGECNSCSGKKVVRPFATWYPFTEDNVKEFMIFCENSGGFKIC